MFAYNICTCAHVEHVRMARNKFTVMYTVMHFAQTMILSDCTSNLKRVSTLRNYGARARVAWMLFNRVLSAVSRVLSIHGDHTDPHHTVCAPYRAYTFETTDMRTVTMCKCTCMCAEFDHDATGVPIQIALKVRSVSTLAL